MPPAEVLAKRLPDVSPAEPAPTPAEQPRGVAMAKTQAQQQQSDATVVAPAQPPEKPSAEKAPNPRVAKADPVAPPLPEASTTSPAGFKLKDCDFCPPLVVLPGGEFQMGSSEHPHEKPAHKVRIPLPLRHRPVRSHLCGMGPLRLRAPAATGRSIKARQAMPLAT